MNTGDLIVWRDEKFGHHRFWRVEGIYLGAEGQESLIELRSMTERPGASGAGRHETTCVPEPLLRNATVYTPGPRPAAA